MIYHSDQAIINIAIIYHIVISYVQPFKADAALSSKWQWVDSITIFAESWNVYKNWWEQFIYTTWYIALDVIQNYNKIKYCIKNS